jgi:hypothetical protein
VDGAPTRPAGNAVALNRAIDRGWSLVARNGTGMTRRGYADLAATFDAAAGELTGDGIQAAQDVPSLHWRNAGCSRVRHVGATLFENAGDLTGAFTSAIDDRLCI